MVKVLCIAHKGRNGNRVLGFFSPRLDTGACEVKLTSFICIMVSSHERVYEWHKDNSDNSGVLNAYIQFYYAEFMLENKQKVVFSFS